MKLFSSATIIIAIVILIIVETEAKNRRKKVCHISYATKCFDYLRRYTAIVNGTGVIETDAEFRHFCEKSSMKIPTCLRNWVMRCGRPVHMELIENIYLKSYVSLMNNFCDPNGITKKRFIKHGACINSKVKLSNEYRDTCINDLQAGLEYSQTLDNGDGGPSYCCVYNRWQQCISKMVKRKCSRDSVAVVSDLINSLSGNLMVIFCSISDFDPESEMCVKVLSSNDSIAKGAKSDSFLSFMFSYLCPNVGYGINTTDMV